MNSVFTAKLLQNLRNKKSNKGFTLIELLVVVIIIGVLAAVALPNLLGQVGKARESEAKTAMGALNRAQQGYHLEARNFYVTADPTTFGDVETALGVVPGGDYYVYRLTSGTATDTTFEAVATNPDNDGTRDFASGVNYNGGAYSTTLCVASNKAANGTNGALRTSSTSATVTATPNGQTCAQGSRIN